MTPHDERTAIERGVGTVRRDLDTVRRIRDLDAITVRPACGAVRDRRAARVPRRVTRRGRKNQAAGECDRLLRL